MKGGVHRHLLVRDHDYKLFEIETPSFTGMQ
jgi:hypothetical protein